MGRQFLIHHNNNNNGGSLSLKNSKGRRGHERDVEAEEVVHLPPVITHPSINICEGEATIIAIFSTQVITHPSINICEGEATIIAIFSTQ